MTETEKAKLIIAISKLKVVAKETPEPCGIIGVPLEKMRRKTETKVLDIVPTQIKGVTACVILEDVLKLISDWGVEE